MPRAHRLSLGTCTPDPQTYTKMTHSETDTIISSSFETTTSIRASTRATHFAKIVMVGECGVGKSSLLRAFCDSDFSPSYLSTVGVDFRIVTVDVGGVIVKLHVWDTAGQERYESLTASYFRGAMGILVCYDASSDKDQTKYIEKWLNIVSKSTDTEPSIMLVGTKLDKCAMYNGITKEEYGDAINAGEIMTEQLHLPCTLTSSLHNVNVKTAFMDLMHTLKDKGQLKHSTSGVATDKEYKPNNDVVYLHCGKEEETAAGNKTAVTNTASCACKACHC